MLLDEAVYHSEHLRLGLRDHAVRPEAAAADSETLPVTA